MEGLKVKRWKNGLSAGQQAQNHLNPKSDKDFVRLNFLKSNEELMVRLQNLINKCHPSLIYLEIGAVLRIAK